VSSLEDVKDRPYVLLSCAMSVDGYIDDSAPQRLRLSNAADFDRVDAVRATCDAILVGANTIRSDDPRLLIRSPARQAQRVARGKPAQLTKVTLTNGGELSPDARFFTTGDEPKLVYASSAVAPTVSDRLGKVAEVIDGGSPVNLRVLLSDLFSRGVGRLMVEGGSGIHTRFLTAGLADELQLVVAPFLVGDPSAPRLVQPGIFPQSPAHPMRLAETTRIGDVALLRYLIGSARG
jgi:5-amino-6-(5-phosphoribosylamino)uracil reductase